MTKKQPSTALIRVEDETKLGPAMQALPNDRMRAFVIALVQTGCAGSRAAELAGYSASSQVNLASRGWHLTHDHRVQAALHEEGIKAIRASGVAGISILAAIAKNPNEAARDRIAAVKELMSRGGFGAVSEHNVNVVHRTEREIDAELLALASELGFTDAQKARLIGHKVTDAQFTEVSASSQAEPVPDYEGLEDVLDTPKENR